MSIICPVLLAIGFLFIAAQGTPFGENDFVSADGSGDFFRKLLHHRFQLTHRWFSQGFNFDHNFENIKSLQPQGPDSHVYGEAEYSFHSSSNNNGQISEQRGGRRIVNKDGVFEEYDLQ